MRSLTLFTSLALLAAGCGQVTATFTPLPDAGIDAAAVDTPIDTPIDTPPPPPPPPPPPGNARELAVVGGVTAAGAYRLEVEVTGGFAAAPTASASHTFTTAIAVTVPQGGN